MASIAPTEFGRFPDIEAEAPHNDTAVAPERKRTNWMRLAMLGAAGVAGAVLVANPVTRRHAIKAARAYGLGKIISTARTALGR